MFNLFSKKQEKETNNKITPELREGAKIINYFDEKKDS